MLKNKEHLQKEDYELIINRYEPAIKNISSMLYYGNINNGKLSKKLYDLIGTPNSLRAISHKISSYMSYEDILQEIKYLLLSLLEDFQPKKLGENIDNKIDFYINSNFHYTIAYEFLRPLTTQPIMDNDCKLDQVVKYVNNKDLITASSEEECIDKNITKNIMDIINTLPAKQKEALVKYKLEEKKLEKIANEMENTKQAVSQLVNRAKKNLKTKLIKNELF